MALIPPAAGHLAERIAADLADQAPHLATLAATEAGRAAPTVVNGDEDVRAGLGETILDGIGASFDWLPFG